MRTLAAAAYLAAFHAAQALIFEREHRTLKTHSGVQSEFAKLVKDDQNVPAELVASCHRPMRSIR